MRLRCRVCCQMHEHSEMESPDAGSPYIVAGSGADWNDGKEWSAPTSKTLCSL